MAEGRPKSENPEVATLRKILATKPRNARILSQLACLLLAEQQQRRHVARVDDEPLRLAQRAAEVSPNKPFGYAALSLVYNKTDQFEQRMTALQEAIYRSQDEQHCIARVDLLVRLLVEPREVESRRILRSGTIGKACSQHPSRRRLFESDERLYQAIDETLTQIWTSNTLPALNRNQQEFVGLQEYRLGLFFRKRQPSAVYLPRAHKHLSQAFHKLSADTEQRALAQFWLATLPCDHHHSTTTISATEQLDKCPSEYVVSLYSSFAERFDDLLVTKLNYQTPTILRTLVKESVFDMNHRHLLFQRAADLGCGTGLSGVSFRDCVGGKLVGVDLSSAMITKARQRQIYDELIVGDVTSILGKHDDKDDQTKIASSSNNTPDGELSHYYDLVVACDVFVYLGDLSVVLDRVRQSLTVKTGVFAFSTELLEEDAAGDNPYLLHACARFAHKQSYVEGLLASRQFEITARKVCPIRKNEGKDVVGFLVVCRLLKRNELT